MAGVLGIDIGGTGIKAAPVRASQANSVLIDFPIMIKPSYNCRRNFLNTSNICAIAIAISSIQN